MLNLKTSPVGIDVPIDALQKQLFSGLTWDSALKGYESYARAYKNEKSGSRRPEVFTSGNDYKEIFSDDNFSASSFFLVSDSSTSSGSGYRLSNDISIIFQVNLKELYPSITHRADEEAHMDVMRILRDDYKGSEVLELITGPNRVYEDLRVQFQTGFELPPNTWFDDMQPYHIFRVDISVTYNLDCEC